LDLERILKDLWTIFGGVENLCGAHMIERRHETRLAVRLPCRAEFGHCSLSGEVVELSSGGARIAFPISGQPAEMQSLASVNIDGIGKIAAEMRWQSGNRVGVTFKRDDLRVQTYLRSVSFLE
jgi:hypothetical protein